VIVLCLFDELCELKHLILLIEGVLISIVGVLIVGGIILLIVLILRKKRKSEKKRKNEQQLNENNSMIQQEKRETVVIESVKNTITPFDETNTNTTTFSTYQPCIHSSQINNQTNKHILSSSQTFDI
jgi:predicted histidine transporter YuiF (NhaC family)